MKVRNIVFSVLLCVLMAGPLLLVCAQEVAKLDLPSWLTSEDAINLAGGVADDAVEDNLSFAAFQEGSLQDALSGSVSNHVPLKSSTLIGKMAVWRGLIDLSKDMFGYDIAPTEPGSEYLYIDEVDAVSYIPIVFEPWMQQGVKTFMDGVSAFAQENPDIDVLVYVVGGFQNPAVSPVYDIDESRSFQKIMGYFEADMVGAPENMHLLGSDYDSLESYYADFFRTDHHWNARGVYKAYAEIAAALGMPQVESSGEIVFDDYRFSGSLGRTSLYDIEEIPFDLDVDFSDLRIVDDEGNVVGDVSQDGYWETVEPGLLRDFYSGYYAGVSGKTVIGGEGERTVVLIGNSYGDSIQRLLAASSAKLSDFDDLHPSFNGSATLADRVTAADADTVIFVASPKDIAILGSQHSDYFD